jgi:hypothetical protein
MQHDDLLETAQRSHRERTGQSFWRDPKGHSSKAFSSQEAPHIQSPKLSILVPKSKRAPTTSHRAFVADSGMQRRNVSTIKVLGFRS